MLTSGKRQWWFSRGELSPEKTGGKRWQEPLDASATTK